MAFSLDAYWQSWRATIEETLERLLPPTTPAPLSEAMRYAVLQGGKRFRPLLAAATAEAFGGDRETQEMAMRAGCCVELIHAHSLVHDDLPCLDNDLLRRGKPTVHAAFGEAMALLAGDGLLSYAFRVLPETLEGLEPSIVLALSRELAGATFDMVRGQVADVLAEGQEVTPEGLSFIHANKTGALIRYSVRAGAHVAGGDLPGATAFAEHLGLAFQIVDDILDETATAEELGKTPGKDRDAGKATYVRLYGIDQAREEAKARSDEAIRIASHWPNPEPLAEIARFVVLRNH
ncbi:MAG: polyprenyl synthetase family protein [Bacteroidota bacterium]